MPKNISRQPPSDEAIELIAARFRALGAPSRLKLIRAMEEGEMSVSQLVAATGLMQSNVSSHLQTLTDAGILTRRKESLSVFYTIADPTVRALYKQAFGRLRKRLAAKASAFGARA